MRKFFTVLIVIPLGLLFVVFAVANRHFVTVSFDPQNVQWANVSLDMPALGFDWHQRFTIRDELTGAVFDWGEHNAVRLDPFVEPAHILSVQRVR